MNLSSLLGGAGVAGAAMRTEEENQRVARDNQLKLEALNREDAARKELLARRSALPDFGAPTVEQIPSFSGLDRRRFPVAPAPQEAAPALPIPQAEPRVPENKPPPPAGYYPKITQGEFLGLSAAERKKRLDSYNQQQRAEFDKAASTGRKYIYTGPMQAAVVAPKYMPAGEEDFVLTLPSGAGSGGPRRGGTRKRAGLVVQPPGMAPELAGSLGVGPLQAPADLTGMTEKAGGIYQRRTQQMPQALQSPFVQSLIQRSQQLDVDPAAAIAISALESGYGIDGTEATSVQGARGSLQVMPATFTLMKNWFTNPDEIKRYNIPQKFVDAATNMTQGTPEGDVDAGLLLLKYNELIGVPKELWGAGYQGNADLVKKLGRPVKASDKNGLSNDEYNSIYINLYNEAAGLLGGVAPAAPAVPGVTPPPAALPPSLTPPQQQQPAATAAAAGPATQLVAPRGGVDTSGVKSPSAFYVGRPDVVAYERQGLDNSFQYQRQMFIDTYKAEMAAGRAREAQAVAAQILALDQGYKTARLLLDGRVALDVLEYQNDPRPVAAILSTFRGQDINFQPVQNGTYNMIINGRNMGNYTPRQISEDVKEYTDSEWVKARNATASKLGEIRTTEGIKTEMKLVEANAQLIREAYLEAIKGNNAVKTELAKQTGLQIFNMANGQTVLFSQDGKKLGIIDPRTGQVVDMDGIAVPLPPTYRPSQVLPQ